MPMMSYAQVHLVPQLPLFFACRLGRFQRKDTRPGVALRRHRRCWGHLTVPLGSVGIVPKNEDFGASGIVEGKT